MRTGEPVIVACLCANWCTVCRDYRTMFNAVATELAHIRFVWIDIEDSAALLEHVEVDNFPTLMIGEGDALRFFGPVLPLRDVLWRLATDLRTGAAAGAHDEAELGDLLRRVQALVAEGKLSLQV